MFISNTKEIQAHFANNERYHFVSTVFSLVDELPFQSEAS